MFFQCTTLSLKSGDDHTFTPELKVSEAWTDAQ